MSASPTGSTTSLGATRDNNPRLWKISRRQFAGEDDWRRHREKICSLYRTKRLKDVMAIMENEHGLRATERMYKARFKDWGLQKNVTAAEVHKLMQKVEQEQQRQHQKPLPGEKGRVVLDVGDDLDLKRIQKYMKRRPKGLDKLRKDPHRPLDVIKALSVDTGKGHGMVSISTVKLKEQEQLLDSLLTSPPSGLALPLSPEPEIPDDITQLLQTFVDNGFDAAYPYLFPPPTPLTPALSPQWQLHSPYHSQSLESVNSSFQAISSRDETMLDFVLKFQVAHILLEQGFTQQGYNCAQMCLGSLALCLQQCQGAPLLGTRSATVMTLWALLAVLEAIVSFKHIEELLVRPLYERLVTSLSAYQPTMAEIVRRLSQLESREQEATIKKARQMILGALSADPSCYEPCLETYSRTVDVSISTQSAVDKERALRTLAPKSVFPGSSILEAWLEMRTAMMMPDTSSALPQKVPTFSSPLGLNNTVMPSSWNPQKDKIASGLKKISERILGHKSAGNWQTAHAMATQAASVAELAWGPNAEMARRFRTEASILRPPEPFPGSLASFEPSLVDMDSQLAGMSFGQEEVESLTWQQKPGHSNAELPAYASLAFWQAAGVNSSFMSGMLF